MKIVEARVHGLVIEPKSQQHIVVLRELDGVRVLPIWIGPGEALAIQRLVQEQEFPRPLTHDLIAMLVEGLKARVTRILISELREATFYATIIVEREGGVLSLDARPSDSIAIALRTKAAIFVNEELLQPPQGPEMAPMSPPPPASGGAGGPSGPEGSGSSGGPGSSDDVEEGDDEAARLRRFLEKLSPEDFGKFNL